MDTTLITNANNYKIVDTLHTANNYVTQTDLTNIYRDFLSNQSSNYTILITALLGITTILIGFSLVWNFVIARNQIKSEVKAEVTILAEELRTEQEKNIKSQLSEFEKGIEIKHKKNEVYLSSLYAYSAYHGKEYTASASWQIESIRLYSQLKDDKSIRKVVDELLLSLKHPDCFNEKPLGFDFDENIKLIEKHIPSILAKEKEEILRILKERKPKSN